MCNSSLAVAIASITSSQILISRGVAGLDLELQHRLEATAAPLVIILENSSTHILYIGPSRTSNITRSYSYSFPPRTHSEAHTEINQVSPTMSGALTTPGGGDSPVRDQASPSSAPSVSAGSSFSFNISSQKSESNSPSSGESLIRGRTPSRTPATNRESAPIRGQASGSSTPSLSAKSISSQKSEAYSPSSREQSPIEGLALPRTPATNRESSPVPAQGSARSTPSLSAESNFSFNISSQKSESNSPSSGKQSPIGGRALSRTPATNLESSGSQASTNFEASTRWFSFDNTLAYQRLLSRDLTAEPEEIFKTVVEPLPVGVERFRSSLSEELYRASTWENLDDSIDLTRFGEHRDTFAILGLCHLHFRRVELPAEFWQRLLQYLNYDTYLSVRLSCRCWSAAISDAHRFHTLPVANRLPLEILQSIYERLDLADFNAARHTCRVWMRHSLGIRPLGVRLERGGWGGAALADRELLEQDRGNFLDKVDLTWLLNKRLATECSLRPGWTGNGLFKSPGARSEGDYYPTVGLVRTSQTDFSELSNGCTSNCDDESGAGLHFTVSVCNKFLLVTKGCIIYIYSLRANWLHTHQSGGHLSPMTIIVCPQRVLSVSMDSSSNRFAVAALLEGRVGIVCDLHQGSSPSEHPLGPRTPSDPSSQTLPTFANASCIPIENGPRCIYGNLCTDECPPLSVAICPQRRCVAFGCKGGIELHWVDGLTGQDHVRWFKLHAPSDSLYFLPSRPGLDSGKKLRLISSAHHPELKYDLRSKFYPGGSEQMNLKVCRVLLYLSLLLSS